MFSALSTASAKLANAETWLFDFGSADFVSDSTYNNVTIPTVSNFGVLKNITGAASAASLKITQGFYNGSNLNGTTAPAASTGFSAAATQDSFFGSTDFNNVNTSNAQMVISGLNPSLLYSFSFMSSRMGVTDNRQTSFTMTGATIQNVLVNASNNSSVVGQTDPMNPTSAGLITIDFKKGPLNNNAHGFFYVNAMRIVSNAGGTPTPSPTPVPTPSPTPVPSPSPTPVGPPATSATITLREGGTVVGTNCGYGEYLPAGFQVNSNAAVLIFMHGAGENGGYLSNAVGAHGPIKEMQSNPSLQSSVNMVVLEPHVISGQCTIDGDDSVALAAFINFAINKYGLDGKHVFITGLSQGGYLTNQYLNNYPKISGAPIPAAGVPLSSHGGFGDFTNLINDHVAVWTGGAISDSLYGGSWGTSDSITGLWHQYYPAAGTFSYNYYPFPGTLSTMYINTSANQYVWLPGMTTQIGGVDINPPYLMSIWPGTGHSTPWSPMYTNPDLYRWLMAHGRP